MQMKRIYFDHNAMSPIRPQALTAMMKILAQVGNPSSVHWYGRKAHHGLEEARETIRIINKYVLKVPLSESEIETVLRDDAFKKPVFFSGSSFLFDKFATFLKNNNHIIKINHFIIFKFFMRLIHFLFNHLKMFA